MKLEKIFPDLNDDSKYRFHLAKQEPGGTRPIDVLARSKDEWRAWQVYSGTNKQRFIQDKIVSFAQISNSKFLFGGIFNITNRGSEGYQVEPDAEHSELIRRLTIDYSGNNIRSTVFTPKYIFSNSSISSILEHPYQGERFVSFDKINHSFEAMNIIVRNELHDWKVALSSVYGVYLLTDTKTGKHYVGSAYGVSGIWGDGLTMCMDSTATIKNSKNFTVCIRKNILRVTLSLQYWKFCQPRLLQKKSYRGKAYGSQNFKLSNLVITHHNRLIQNVRSNGRYFDDLLS